MRFPKIETKLTQYARRYEAHCAGFRAIGSKTSAIAAVRQDLRGAVACAAISPVLVWSATGDRAYMLYAEGAAFYAKSSSAGSQSTGLSCEGFEVAQDIRPQWDAFVARYRVHAAT